MNKMTTKVVSEHLVAINKRRAIVETALRAVTQGYCPALFVWGGPGLGKSHMLTSMLDGLLGKAWKHHSAYSTPKGLMLSLAESPGAIHLFEDCEKMLKTDLSASILRAACGSPNDRERWVTYETATERLKVKVTGGVIVATNQNLARASGPMQGVASRFRPIRWDLSYDERLAVILDIASRPWSRGKDTITAKQCATVANTLLDILEDRQLAIELDVRLFVEHALPTYAYCLATGTNNWQDVLEAKLTGIVSTNEEGQSQRTSRLENLALQIDQGGGNGAEKIAKWKGLTGLGQAIYYRHLKAAKRVR